MARNLRPREVSVEELAVHARTALERQYPGVEYSTEIQRLPEDTMPTMRIEWLDGPILMEVARVLEPYSNMGGGSLYYLKPDGEMLFRSPAGVARVGLDDLMPDDVEIVRQEPHYTHVHREETMVEDDIP